MLIGDRRFRRWTRAVLALSLLAGVCAPGATAQVNQSDWTKRDAWQRPAEVMDAMGAAAGSVVADIGAGGGYFTFRLAERVGPQGKVYAVDLDKLPLEKLHDRAEKEGLKQIETIVGLGDDPRLPASALDAILVVNAYHEMRSFDAMLQGMFRALKPGGKLVIIEQPSKPGSDREEYFRKHELPEEIVREDALRNGFRFLSKAGDIITADKSPWYFLIFEKPGGTGLQPVASRGKSFQPVHAGWHMLSARAGRASKQ